MKIALLIQSADRQAGGAESYTLDLARSLAGMGHAVTVVAQERTSSAEESAAAGGFSCRFLGASGGYRWARLKDFVQRLDGVYRSGAYDVVHAMLPVRQCDVYQPHSGLAREMWLTGHMKYHAGFVRNCAQRCNYWNFKRRGLARIEAGMMQHRPWVLCLSEAMRSFARAHYAPPEDRLVLLINGINQTRFDPEVGMRWRTAIRDEWRIGSDQRLALLVGNNWKLKGVREAIVALARQAGKQTVLMMVGRGNPEGFRRLAQKLGVAERVLFAGSVNDPRPYYGAADYLLLPTKRDTCSLVVLEALSMGLPVVTTRQNGASDVIADQEQGIVLEHGDENGLAAAMGLMADRQRLAGMSKAALGLRGELSLDRHLERIEEVYERIVAARQATTAVKIAE